MAYGFEGHKELSNAILQHFWSIYAREPCSLIHDYIQATPKLVPDELLRLLQNPVSEKDIKDAVFDLGALKALGSDGYNGLFFQKYWETMKLEV
ncbi:hypothetical protein SESBI_40675 [Sesbania bispinosa]|nr:hypothetical protein SESBI_40675 [Sesbania bispinosa]